jgi:O-antigen/teichoic acid export membrane protein
MFLSSVAAFGARGIGLLAGLVSIPLTYRYLGAESYGLWMTLVSIITAMAVADLGIGFGVMNAVSEAYGKDDRKSIREYATSGFVLMLCIGAVLAVAGLVAYPSIPWQRLFNVKSATVANQGAEASAVLFGWFVLNIPLSVITRIQAGLQRAYWSQIVSACGNALSLLGLILVIELRGSLPWLVFASTFGEIAATICNGLILLWGMPWLLPSRNAFSSSAAKRILRLGLHFFIGQCAVALGFNSDNIVITQVLGAAAVPVYGVPQKLFGLSSQLINIGISPIWPAYGEALARRDHAWIRRTFRNSIIATLSLAIPVCTFLALKGQWVLRVIVGKSLHVPVSLFWTLAAWGIITAVWIPVAILLNGTGVIKVLVRMTAISSVVNLTLSIYLARRLGVIGVCLGSIITQVAIMAPVGVYQVRGLFKRMNHDGFTSDSLRSPLTVSAEGTQ